MNWCFKEASSLLFIACTDNTLFLDTAFLLALTSPFLVAPSFRIFHLSSTNHTSERYHIKAHSIHSCTYFDENFPEHDIAHDDTTAKYLIHCQNYFETSPAVNLLASVSCTIFIYQKLWQREANPRATTKLLIKINNLTLKKYHILWRSNYSILFHFQSFKSTNKRVFGKLSWSRI